MTRITTTILVIMILVNGGVAAMEASGLSEDLGVTLSPGIDKTLEETTETIRDFQTSEGLGDTLFALFKSAGNVAKVMVSAVFAAPSMLINIGFPAYLVAFLFGPVYILGTLEMVSIFTGRRMI